MFFIYINFPSENQTTTNTNSEALTQCSLNNQNNMNNLDNPPTYNNLENTESINQNSPPSYINVINKI